VQVFFASDAGFLADRRAGFPAAETCAGAGFMIIQYWLGLPRPGLPQMT
jgi:hypothetical protein